MPANSRWDLIRRLRVKWLMFTEKLSELEYEQKRLEKKLDSMLAK